MASANVETFLLIANTCTNYAGAEVSITVPGAGTVVVWATVGVLVEHFMGTDDIPMVFLGEDNADCNADTWRAYDIISDTDGTGDYGVTLTVMEPFSVAGAGTYTYYLNGEMWWGASAGDMFFIAGTIAVYYPS